MVLQATLVDILWHDLPDKRSLLFFNLLFYWLLVFSWPLQGLEKYFGPHYITTFIICETINCRVSYYSVCLLCYHKTFWVHSRTLAKISCRNNPVYVISFFLLSIAYLGLNEGKVTCKNSGSFEQNEKTA